VEVFARLDNSHRNRNFPEFCNHESPHPLSNLHRCSSVSSADQIMLRRNSGVRRKELRCSEEGTPVFGGRNSGVRSKELRCSEQGTGVWGKGTAFEFPCPTQHRRRESAAGFSRSAKGFSNLIRQHFLCQGRLRICLAWPEAGSFLGCTEGPYHQAVPGRTHGCIIRTAGVRSKYERFTGKAFSFCGNVTVSLEGSR
jgi:hypothetical protein